MNQNDAMEAVRCLQGLWAGFLLNPRVKRVNSTITWELDDRRHLPERVLANEFELLSSQKQYSFQLFDGSLIQIFYRFDTTGGSLEEAHLAFVQSPRGDAGDETLNQEEIQADGVRLLVEHVTKIIYPLSWIRFDFEPKLWGGCIHANCHMHSSLSSDLRVPFAGVPSPHQFIDAIAAWFYPAIFRRVHMKEGHLFKDHLRMRAICSERLATKIDLQATQLVHLTLPVPMAGQPLLSGGDDDG